MTTAYTSLLGLALPVTGELSGTWGDTVNSYITAYLDAAVAGTNTLSSDSDVTLVKTTNASLTGTSSQYAVLLWTAGGTATRTIIAPSASSGGRQFYIVVNKTSSTQSIKLCGAGPTTGVTVTAGTSALCAWNGSDFIQIGAGLISLTTGVTGVLPVANGGTGLTSLSTLQAPVGSFMWHTASTAPTNYLEANGAAISRTTYASLFAVIGTTYGTGDGTTTFNVPDVRGYFVRGYDNGRGVDSGRAFGSNQANSIQSHTHGMWQALSRDSAQGDPNATAAGTFSGGGGGFFAHPNTDSAGSTETRPVNIAFLPCIRYQ
jgi:phage-related tail fiber protein